VLKFLRDEKFEMDRAGREMTKDCAEKLIIEHFRGEI
jgi:hypothetical protein